MIPNIVYSVKCREGFENKWKNKPVEMLEQIGRYGCMCFMILIVPILGAGIPTGNALAVYLSVDSFLVLMYCLLWIVLWNSKGLLRAFSLSIIPSVIFLFCGIMTHYILLIITALIFAPAHILISYKNAE